MKLTVSGWPGGGSSTLALLLCKTLGLTHVRGGETFRYLYTILDSADTGLEHLDAHERVETLFGKIYDDFIKHLLTSDKFNNCVVESDIAGFMGKEASNVFSIFLKTTQEVRAERMGDDKRKEDGDILDKLDERLANTYEEIHGIRWFDEQEIERTHTIFLNNSEMNLVDELKVIYQALNAEGYIEDLRLTELNKEAAAVVEDFCKEGGKGRIKDELKERGLVMNPEEILAEIRGSFSSEVDGIEDTALKEAILNA